MLRRSDLYSLAIDLSEHCQQGVLVNGSLRYMVKAIDVVIAQ